MADGAPRTINIEGKVMLVTGANRGIGKALVEGFIAAGAKKIYAAVRNPSSVDGLVARHGTERVVPILMDVSDAATIRAAAETSCGDVNVVVNNAGVLELVPPMDKGFLPSLQRQMEVNVYSLVHMAQEFAPILERNGGGALVQMNSTSSLRCPGADFAGYAASKAASFSIVQGLRHSLPKTLVVSVHPGPIATDMVDQFGARGRSEPASQVADAVIKALQDGEFLVLTDTMSRNIGAEYSHFYNEVVEPCSRPVPSTTPID